MLLIISNKIFVFFKFNNFFLICFIFKIVATRALASTKYFLLKHCHFSFVLVCFLPTKFWSCSFIVWFCLFYVINKMHLSYSIESCNQPSIHTVSLFALVLFSHFSFPLQVRFHTFHFLFLTLTFCFQVACSVLCWNMNRRCSLIWQCINTLFFYYDVFYFNVHFRRLLPCSSLLGNQI